MKLRKVAGIHQIKSCHQVRPQDMYIQAAKSCIKVYMSKFCRAFPKRTSYSIRNETINKTTPSLTLLSSAIKAIMMIISEIKGHKMEK